MTRGMTEVPCPAPCRKNLCFRIARGGTTYRCAKAFALATGITRGAVYQSLSRTGSVERVGISRGGRCMNVRPITVGPHSWPSVSAMARDLGANRSTLGKWVKHKPEAVLSLVMQWSIKEETKL